MDDNTFKILTDDARLALDEHRLVDALNALEGMLAYSGTPQAADALAAIRTDYDRLLDYMAQGYADEGRTTLFRRFLLQAYTVWQSMRREGELRLTTGRTDYALTAATLRRMQVPQKLCDMAETQTISSRVIFDAIHVSGIWEHADVEAVRRLFEEADDSRRCLIISATTLATLHYFDSLKLTFLIDVLELVKTPVLQARALVGAVMVLLRWPTPCDLAAEPQERFVGFVYSSGLQNAMIDLQAFLLLAPDAKRVERKLENEIMPEVMKHARDFKLRDKGLSLGDWQEELTRLSGNPEWENATNGLSDKMKEVAELHKRGVDVSLGLFKQLQQRFSFFNVAANWFWPYTTTHPDLVNLKGIERVEKFLSANSRTCDTDKYAFSFMMLWNGALMNSGLAEALGTEGGDLGNLLRNGATAEGDTLTASLRSYIQDLYRFFTLYRGRDGYADPFKCDLLLIDYPALADIIVSSPRLAELADACFSMENHTIALRLFAHMEPSAQVFQKMGYCHQALCDYAKAIEAYERASLMQPSSVWTLRQLAACQRRVGQLTAAQATYAELERLEPEAADVSLRRGECYIATREFDLALKSLFRAYYLRPDNSRILRAMAWSFLQLGQDENAEKYYSHLLGAAPIREDYLNAGHAAWLSGNMREAVQRYKTFIALAPNDSLEPDIFAADRELLIARGIDADELRVMEDLLRRNGPTS